METGQKTIQKKTRIDKASNIKLSIHISLNGLSFSVVDLITGDISFYKRHVFKKKSTPKNLLKELKKYIIFTIPKVMNIRRFLMSL